MFIFSMKSSQVMLVMSLQRIETGIGERARITSQGVGAKQDGKNRVKFKNLSQVRLQFLAQSF
jgi:hypothetical protein